MNSLGILHDSLLIEAYRNAMRLNLSTDFISILLEEIEKRDLYIIDWF